jgi:hypothetical protein
MARAAARKRILNVPGSTPTEGAERPPSPCINVCSLDAQGFCIGCLRTGEEIGRWMSMSPAQQWQLLRLLSERRTLKR